MGAGDHLYRRRADGDDLRRPDLQLGHAGGEGPVLVEIASSAPLYCYMER